MDSETPNSEINPSDLREIISYISRMKEYDRANFYKLLQINDLIWGVLFLIGGIMDALLHYHDLPDSTSIPWAIISISGMSLSIYLNTRKPKEIITDEVEKASTRMVSMYRYVLALTIISWAVMTVFIYLSELYFLIIPLISFIIGSAVIGFNLDKSDTETDSSVFELKRFYNPKNRLAFIAFSCFLASSLNIILFIINPVFIKSMGVIMGVLLAVGFGSGAFVER